MTIPGLNFGSFEGASLGTPVYAREEELYQAAVWDPLPIDVDCRMGDELNLYI
jgi:hypothetical protein